MNYEIKFTKEADKMIEKYKKSNPNTYKKLSRLLLDLIKNPREGIGHPEPLIKGNSVTYSRRISGKDRLIYDVYDDLIVVLVLSVEGHYRDK